MTTDTTVPSLPATPPLWMMPPRIVPNRKHLDNRFPVLGFTIFADGPRYYEVLLATDRALFSPANAGRRVPSNFYSSRQDSKLGPITMGTAIYLVPGAVLKGFAQAHPRPSEIYYTVVVYSSPEGANPVFVKPPDELPSSAPSVTMSGSFSSRAFSGILGFSPERLRKHDTSASSGGMAWAQAEMPPVREADPEEDRVEGEDGYLTAAPEPMSSMNRSAYQSSLSVAAATHKDEYEDRSTIASSAAVTASHAYSDGYDGEVEPAAQAQQREYPAGAQEPVYLVGQRGGDDDEGYGDGDDDGGGFAVRLGSPAAAGRATYGDEAEEGGYDDHVPVYRSLTAELEAQEATASVPLTIEAKRDLIGKLGRYDDIVADGEFEGEFSQDHPAYHSYHLGLSYGVVQFNQDTGTLGQLLSMMHDRDPGKFQEIFGRDSEGLLQVTNARGPASKDSPEGRSFRVQPIGGADLWKEPWVSRFRAAAQVVAFQAAQNQLAAQLFLDPMLQFAEWMDLTTERLLAILTDSAAAMGVQAAQQWVADAASPLQSAAQRQQALGALRFTDVRAFQAATPGLEPDGRWGPLTQAAAVSALRKLASASTVPVPSPKQVLAALIRRSAPMPWGERVAQLRESHELRDMPYQV